MTTGEGLRSHPSTPDGSDKQHRRTSSDSNNLQDIIRDTLKTQKQLEQNANDAGPSTPKSFERRSRSDSPNPTNRRGSFDLRSSLASHRRDLTQHDEKRSTSPSGLSPRPEERHDHTAIKMDRLRPQEPREATTITESYDNLRKMEEGRIGENSDNINSSRYEQLFNQLMQQHREYRDQMNNQLTELRGQMTQEFSHIRAHFEHEQAHTRGSDHSSTSSTDSQTPWYRSWDWHNTRGNTYASYFGGYVGGAATLASLGITIYEGWSLMHPSHA